MDARRIGVPPSTFIAGRDLSGRLAAGEVAVGSGGGNRDAGRVRLASMIDTRTGRGLAAALLVLTVILAACGGATTDPPASAPPDTPVTSPPDGGDGGGGVPGTRFVVPKPGQLDVRPIPAEAFEATVDGSTVHLVITWTSGVEPCYVLDSIVIQKGDPVITVTLREGHAPGDPVCIEIAAQYRTAVDITDLDPGTYTIRDGAGGAPDIEVTVG